MSSCPLAALQTGQKHEVLDTAAAGYALSGLSAARKRRGKTRRCVGKDNDLRTVRQKTRDTDLKNIAMPEYLKQ